jgi:hypothetical protein
VTPLKLLKLAQKNFRKLDCKYCLVGGHAASLYRSQERLTRDVDFAISVVPPTEAKEIAKTLIACLKLEPVVAWIPCTAFEPKRKAICMITSAPAPGTAHGLVNILLPELPWVENAVRRAQFNFLNLGFASIPVITPEDLIVAKCYALRNSPDRFQDLDDLKEIFKYVKDLDLDYLRAELSRLELVIPEQIKKYAPW